MPARSNTSKVLDNAVFFSVAGESSAIEEPEFCQCISSLGVEKNQIQAVLRSRPSTHARLAPLAGGRFQQSAAPVA